MANSQSIDKITKRFNLIRNLSEEICKLFSDTENNIQLSYDVSPNKWQLGHTTWFFDNFIVKPRTGKIYNEEFYYKFNSYYNSQGKQFDKAKRFELDKPSFQEVIDYRKHINFEMEKLIENNLDRELAFFIELGLNHEQQHQELMLADTKYSLFHSGILDSKLESKINHQTKEMKFDNVKEGIYQIGYDGDCFFYDVEKEIHKFYLDSFEIADRLVSNGEYLEFINDDGYLDPLLWHSDGWKWANKLKTKAPEYWIFDNDSWKEFTYHGFNELELNKPVSHINYYEAWAYAKWAGARLPKEQEWEIACNQFGDIKNSNLLSYDFNQNKLQTYGSNNIKQYFGDGWEWTESAFLPYPNYKQDKGALGEYNGKFMINTMVLRGGCSYTPIDHIRSTYRNFYHPEKRWMQSGIRLAKDKV